MTVAAGEVYASLICGETGQPAPECPTGSSSACTCFTKGGPCATTCYCDPGRCPIGQGPARNFTVSSGCPCQKITCPSGQGVCAGVCTPLNTVEHCGTCSTQCPAGASCTPSGCQCASGAVVCGGTCASLSTDPNNCGSCGNACPGGGECCNGQCANTNQSCGSCGNACGPNETCFNGCCVTNAGSLSSLGSSTNYFLFNGCNPVLELSVSLQITEDMVAEQGFSFQLNAYNPAGPTTSWMQYIIMMNGTGFAARIEYWDVAQVLAGQGGTGGCCAVTFPGSASLPFYPLCNCSSPTSIPGVNVSQANTVPAGYTLKIELSTLDSGEVTGANFTIFDNAGNAFPLFLPVSDSDFFFPIVAFQANLVGYENSGSTAFASGAGNIIYEVPQGQLCVEGGMSEKCANSVASANNWRTAETSLNSSYGPMSSCCGPSLSQSFFSNPVTPCSEQVGGGWCHDGLLFTSPTGCTVSVPAGDGGYWCPGSPWGPNANYQNCPSNCQVNWN